MQSEYLTSLCETVELAVRSCPRAVANTLISVCDTRLLIIILSSVLTVCIPRDEWRRRSTSSGHKNYRCSQVRSISPPSSQNLTCLIECDLYKLQNRLNALYYAFLMIVSLFLMPEMGERLATVTAEAVFMLTPRAPLSLLTSTAPFYCLVAAVSMCYSFFFF